MRPQPAHTASTSALATSASMLTKHKPQLLYIPHILVPDTAQTIKAEPTACTKHTSYLFVLRQDNDFTSWPKLEHTYHIFEKVRCICVTIYRTQAVADPGVLPVHTP